MEEKDYWLGFSVFPGIGPKKFQLILKHFSSAKNAWLATGNELEASGIGKVTTAKFINFRSSFRLNIYKQKLIIANVDFLILSDKEYPLLLKQINNPPFVLYVKGDKELLHQTDKSKFVAIVGTRKITDYGREVTKQITESFVQAGWVVVSGLAYGVDACAHTVTVENNGKTIAVLGCGVDCCTPREKLPLYNRIIKDGGCIISESPLGSEPTKGSFPSRNRIIAGISQAVIVTEGTQDSGALYTASDAFLLNRPVFAVPGPITSQYSKGTNKLITKGAKLVMSGEDVLKEMGFMGSIGTASITRKKITCETKEEQMIIDLLENEQLHFDELIRKTGLESSQLGILLSMMEMKGFIKTNSNGIFSRVF
jgi:DNA processing protein